jgi:hypothetical protein
MSDSQVQDGMVVLEFACNRLREMMGGNSEGNSFASVLEKLGLLSCSTDEAMKGLVRMKNIHDGAMPPPHIWDTVCLAAWILATAQFLRSASPKKVSIVEDMLFHRGDANTPVSSIRLPSAGELRMITIMAIYYTAVCEKVSAADAVESLLGMFPRIILIYVSRRDIKEGMRAIKGRVDAERACSRFDKLIAAYECTELVFDFMFACRTIDSICGSKFLLAFSVEAIDVCRASVAPQTRDDIVRSLVFCLHGLKIQGGLPKERLACISWENALQKLEEFNLQDMGSLNHTIRALHERSKCDKDLMQVRSQQLLASLKWRIQ